MIAKTKFYRELSWKLSLEIEKARAEMEAMEPPSKPIYSEQPIDPELQTGDSKLLGGEMRLRAPFTEDSR